MEKITTNLAKKWCTLVANEWLGKFGADKLARVEGLKKLVEVSVPRQGVGNVPVCSEQ